MKRLLAPLSRILLGLTYVFLFFLFILYPGTFFLEKPVQTVILFTLFIVVVTWRGLNNLEAFDLFNDKEISHEDEGEEMYPKSKRVLSKKRWTLPILWIDSLGMVVLAWDGFSHDLYSNPYISWGIILVFIFILAYRAENNLPAFTLSSL